jgi:hypothetical protein
LAAIKYGFSIDVWVNLQADDFVPVLFRLVSIAVFPTPLVAHADPIPKGWQASTMKVIGHSGLDRRLL